MHRFLKLLARNGPARAPKIVRGYAPDFDGDADHPGKPDIDTDGQSATIYFYDVIGGWDQPQTEDVVRAIAALRVKTIHMRVNSPGGLVFESVAIKTALEQHPARVIAHVDGVAASAASTLMLAADEIDIAPGAFVMIHNPETMAWGDADELRSGADMLDAIRDSIAGQYVARTGLPVARVNAMMAAETWMSATQAVEMKFCDRVMDKPSMPANQIRRFDLTAWKNVPAELLVPAPPAPKPDFASSLLAARERAEARLRLFELNA